MGIGNGGKGIQRVKRGPRDLEVVIAETFRRAWWYDNGGHPCCPTCYDGVDVKPGYKALRTHPHLRMYYCSACKREFSDLSCSVLAGIKTPLSLYACGVLGVHPQELSGHGGKREWARRTIVQQWRRLHDSKFAERWRDELKAAGITAERLVAAVSREEAPSRAPRSSHPAAGGA